MEESCEFGAMSGEFSSDSFETSSESEFSTDSSYSVLDNLLKSGSQSPYLRRLARVNKMRVTKGKQRLEVDMQKFEQDSYRTPPATPTYVELDTKLARQIRNRNSAIKTRENKLNRIDDLTYEVFYYAERIEQLTSESEYLDSALGKFYQPSYQQDETESLFDDMIDLDLPGVLDVDWTEVSAF